MTPHKQLLNEDFDALRRLLLHLCGVFLVLFSVSLYFNDRILTALMAPVVHLVSSHHLIATGMLSAVTVPLHVAMMSALLVILPYALFFLWRFIKPALYPHERRVAGKAMLVSLSIFYIMITWLLYMLLPFWLSWLSQWVPSSVMWMPDMTHYIHFVTQLVIGVGVFSQIPCVMLVLVLIRWVHYDRLKAMRRHVCVGCFIMGMLLTPPDVVAQIMVALPMYAMYEIGLLLCRGCSDRSP